MRVYGYRPTERTATAVTYKNRVKIFRSQLRQIWCPCLKIVIQLGKQLLTWSTLPTYESVDLHTSKRCYFNRNDNCKCPPFWGSGQYDNWRARESQGDQATLFSYLKVYVSEMRRQVSNSGSKYIDDRSMPVFLSWNGANLNLGNSLLLSMLLGRRQGWKGMFLQQYFGSQPSQRFMEITKK